MKNVSIIAATILGLSVSTASAVTFSGTATGSWANPEGTFGFDINNNDSGGTADVDWGTASGTDLNNVWSFNGAGSDGLPGWSSAAGGLFSLGDFTYHNGSVNSHDFEGADLSIELAITDPFTDASIYDFNFAVDNVPNSTGDPVLDGDIAQITGTVSSQSFSWLGVNYELSLFGFSQDGGLTIVTGFNIPEGDVQTAELYGSITEVAAVPVPAGLPLILTGLAAFGVMRRNKRSA